MHYNIQGALHQYMAHLNKGTIIDYAKKKAKHIKMQTLTHSFNIYLYMKTYLN